MVLCEFQSVGFFLFVFLAWLVCFFVSKLFAMWSPGRARRAYHIAGFLAVLLLALGAMSLAAMVNDPYRDGGGGITGSILRAFLLFSCLGALLNVWTCWLGARREARAALEETQSVGFSRESS